MKNFIATVNEEHMNDVQGVANQLVTLGCVISNVFVFGVIAGSVDDAVPLENLHIEGILSVELDKEVRAI